VGDPFALVVLSRQLGQDLMAPPNVKGWPGGEAWINASTLLARKQMLERLFRVSERSGMTAGMQTTSAAAAGNPTACRPRPAAASSGRSPRCDSTSRSGARAYGTSDPDALALLLLPVRPTHAIDPAQDRLAVIRQLALDPVYQLR
jgi:hypothetical protein